MKLPYAYLPQAGIVRVKSIEHAQHSMSEQHPDMVCLSASFSLVKQHSFLEQLRRRASVGLPALVSVLDFDSNRSVVPRGLWGYKRGVLHTYSSAKEVAAMIERLQQW